MSELDIARLLNDKVVDFGNERFLEGWNGATEHIIKLLEEFIENCDLPEVEDRFEWFKDSIKGGK